MKYQIPLRVAMEILYRNMPVAGVGGTLGARVKGLVSQGQTPEGVWQGAFTLEVQDGESKAEFLVTVQRTSKEEPEAAKGA